MKKNIILTLLFLLLTPSTKADIPEACQEILSTLSNLTQKKLFLKSIQEGSAECLVTEEQKITFAFMADYGDGGEHEREVADLIKNANPDFILTGGDNNYIDNTAYDQAVGEFYHDYMFPYSGSYGSGSSLGENQFFPCPGNHDGDVDEEVGLSPWSSYVTFFQDMIPNSSSGNDRYYEVDLGERGLVHLFCVNSDYREIDGRKVDSVQAIWLQTALANSKALFNVVVLHHPPYSSGSHGSNENVQWPFKDWGADVVLSGHNHIYERLEVDGLTYFVSGLGGESRSSTINPVPESLIQYNDDYGALFIQIDAITKSALFQFMTVDGILIDEHLIVSDN